MSTTYPNTLWYYTPSVLFSKLDCLDDGAYETYSGIVGNILLRYFDELAASPALPYSKKSWLKNSIRGCDMCSLQANVVMCSWSRAALCWVCLLLTEVAVDRKVKVRYSCDHIGIVVQVYTWVYLKRNLEGILSRVTVCVSVAVTLCMGSSKIKYGLHGRSCDSNFWLWWWQDVICCVWTIDISRAFFSCRSVYGQKWRLRALFFF